MTDGRSATARRFRDLYEEILADLGGPDVCSEGQRQLARRAAMLSAKCERQEALAVRGERPRDEWQAKQSFFDINQYGILCDRLTRLFHRLGLERKPREVSNPFVEHFKGAP